MANSPFIYGPNGATALVPGGVTLPGSTSGTIQIQPAASTTSYGVKMPAAQGATGTALVNDGSGNLSWTTPSTASTLLASTQFGLTSGSGTYYLPIMFYVSSANATSGAVYEDSSSNQFDVQATISGGTILYTRATGSSLPAVASGTLTKLSGTGDSTITFTSYVSPLQLMVYMLGGGGGGAGSGTGSSGGIGTSGGNTTFGTSLLEAGGGSGGGNATSKTIGGLGGTIASVSLPALNLASIFGFAGSNGDAAITSGPGGSGGGPGGGVSSTAAQGPGGGGGGAIMGGTSGNGGGGGGSGATVYAFIPNPAALSVSYSYSVGTGGGGGTAGTTGNAGSSGAQGIILIQECYQ